MIEENKIEGLDKKVEKKVKVKGNFNAKKSLYVILVLILLAAIAYLIVDKNNNTQKTYITEEDSAIVEKVKKLMILPERTPTVTTVANADEIKKQEFFKNVKNDDKILIYLEDTKVVVYRPSENKIINVGPIVNDDSAKTDETTTTETKK